MWNYSWVFITFIFSKWVSILSLLLAPLLVFKQFLAFHIHSFYKSLQFNVYLFNRPAFSHPILKLGFQIFVSHLPHFNLSSYFGKLRFQLFYFVIYFRSFRRCQILHEGFELKLSLPSFLKLLFHPYKKWSYLIITLCLRDIFFINWSKS